MFPTIAPIEKIEPIHEISSTVNAPDSRGLSFDLSSFNDGESQPNPLP